jgi:Na+/proline symporter
LVGILVIGGIFSKKMKNSEEMFVAGRNSSWWVAGLSTYMTLFSAGTFVVWGGIAYRLGFVAISILTIIGLSSIFVGRYLAGRWRQLGIKSPAEYLGIRFGKKTISFYTIVGLIGRGVSVAVALYAVSILMVALIPLPESHFLCDPQTGNMSVTYAILILGATAIIYTIAGGLWAVLMTDVIQFAILVIMIILMIPLSFKSAGGVEAFVNNSPTGFFSPVSGEYSFLWLILWGITYFFMVGGDWPFVQRYICVPTAKDAKKAAYLVAALYLITPLFWMLPALIYRVINPGANPEQAYILISQHVLPPGMLGLMMAAMISATLSMVDSLLNVFAGVFTRDIYYANNPNASEKRLVNVGRIFTFGFGLIVIVLATLIPLFGGAESVIVAFVTLVIGPLAIPSVWGLFSKKIGQKAVGISLGVAYLIGIIVKIGFSGKGLFITNWQSKEIIIAFFQENSELINAIIGVVIPILILTIIEILARNKNIYAGWNRMISFMNQQMAEEKKTSPPATSQLPVKILIWTFALLGISVGWVALVNKDQQNILIMFSAILLTISAIIYIHTYISRRKNNA